jgi:D-alanyl-D-alanine carboxypeptidase/D-alanyl-D-alanine-endopeptidase (penicillin-binding protein 4)
MQIRRGVRGARLGVAVCLENRNRRSGNTASSFGCLYALLVLLSGVFPNGAKAEASQKPYPVRILQLKEELLTSLPSNAKWSVAAYDVKTGEKIISEGNPAGQPLTQASLVKLVVTSAVLDLDNTEAIHMDTFVAADRNVNGTRIEGNIYLKGSGNAFLSEADLNAAADEMFANGIQEISGDLVVDDSLFRVSGWKPQWKGPAYAMPGALGMDLHTVSVSVTENPHGVHVDPVNEEVAIHEAAGNTTSIERVDDLHYEVTFGHSGSGALQRRYELDDPALYAGQSLKTILMSKGVSIRGTTRKGVVPAAARVTQTIRARDLAEIVRLTNSNSLNVVAENLLLLLGANKFGPPGTLEKGKVALREFIVSLGMNPEAITIEDGCGLSAANRVSADDMAQFLARVAGREWFGALFGSLNRGDAEDDEARYRPAIRLVRVKSGQTPNVYSMAGYIDSGSGHLIAFCTIVNVPGAELFEKESSKLVALFTGLAEERSR